MSKNKKDSQDLTRIEDLSDFLHDEDEEIFLLDDKETPVNSAEKSIMELEKESFGDSTTFMQIPDELTESSDLTFDEPSDDLNEESIEDHDNDFNSFNNDEMVTSDFEDESFNGFENQSDDFENEENDNSFSDDFESNFDIDEDDQNAEMELFDKYENANESEELDDDAPLQDKKNEKNTKTEDLVSKEIENKIVPILPPKDYQAPIELDELKEFGQTITATDLSIEGNPPFSIIASQIKFQEDAESILEILKEYKIIKPEHENDAKASLERGQILIPRLSEYSAIILYHRLRRFNLMLKMGLSHEIHKSSTFEKSDKGLVSKFNINTNIKRFEDLTKDIYKSSDVQVTTQNSLDNFTTIKNISVKSRSKIIDNDLLDEDNFDNTYEQLQIELIDVLKKDAAELNANALLSLSITLINKSKTQTSFICTANIAIVTRKNE